MLIADFRKNNINNFTPAEVCATGAYISDVKTETMIAIQKYREYIRRPVHLIKNGMTTGSHISKAHPEGYAVDFWLHPKDGPINIHQIYKGCLHAGFRAFGIYWNQKIFSFHGEVSNPYRSDFARWIGVKDEARGITEWQWFSLLQDPRKITL